MREPPQADHRSRQRIPVIRCYEHLPPLRELPRLPEVLAAAGYVEPVGSERIDDHRYERDRHREPVPRPSRHGDALHDPPPAVARLVDAEDFDDIDTEDTIDVPEMGGES